LPGTGITRNCFTKNIAEKWAVFVFGMRKNKEEAEDFLQDAFIRIFKNLHQFKAKGSLEGWIRRIVINTIMESMRKKSLMFKVVDLEEAGMKRGRIASSARYPSTNW
jgi:RNA polymerase sigma-70 factor (ECF subfamily)